MLRQVDDSAFQSRPSVESGEAAIIRLPVAVNYLLIKIGVATQGKSMPKIVSRDAYLALAKVIEDARLAAGLTQTELGVRMGVGQKLVSMIETGARRVDALELLAFERALHLESFALTKRVLKHTDDKEVDGSTAIRSEMA